MINLLNLFRPKQNNLNVKAFLNKFNCNKICVKKEHNIEIYEYKTIHLNQILSEIKEYSITPIVLNNLYFFYIFYKSENKHIIITPSLLNEITTLDEFCYNYKDMFSKINISIPEKRNILTHLYYVLNITVNNTFNEELSYKYDLVIFDRNNITIHNKIECDLYKSESGMIKRLPVKLRTMVGEIRFTTNSSNLLVEVKAFTNKNIHPNINYENNKYCIGNFIHKKIDSQIIEDVIETMKIYNLTNYYKLDPSLKALLNATSN